MLTGKNIPNPSLVLSYLSSNKELALILSILFAQFILFSSAFPLAGSIDEIGEAIDGLAVKSYILDTFASGPANPISYFEEVQSHAFGLNLKSRPPYFRVLEAVAFIFLEPGMGTARLLVFLHAALFFAAWYYFTSRDYGKGAALFSSLFLLVSLAFIQFSWRVYLEFAYLLFALIAVMAFKGYLREQSSRNLFILCAAVLLGLMTKEVFVSIFLSFAVLAAFELKGKYRIGEARRLAQRILSNGFFLPSFAIIAAISIPWYVIKASTPLAASLAAGKPFAPADFLTYPVMLISQEPILTAGFALYCALCLFAKGKKNPFSENDIHYLSLLAGFFIVVSLASHKEIRYLFFLYPVAALMLYRALETVAPSKKELLALASACVLSQAALSAISIGSVAQISYSDYESAAQYIEAKGGNYLFAGNPSNSAISYYLLLDGDWRSKHLTRLYKTAFDPVAKAYGISNTSSREFFYSMLDYYSIDSVIVERSFAGDVPEYLTAVSEVDGSGKFELMWEQNAIGIYRYKK